MEPDSTLAPSYKKVVIEINQEGCVAGQVEDIQSLQSDNKVMKIILD
jgi:hypothetical protein